MQACSYQLLVICNEGSKIQVLLDRVSFEVRYVPFLTQHEVTSKAA